MKKMKSIGICVSAAFGLMSCALLTSCGGDNTADPPYDSPGGYWTGSYNGEPGVALIDEAGDFTFIANDGEQFPGAVIASGSTYTGSVQGFTPGGFPNYGTENPCGISGTFSGTLLPRSSLSGTATFPTPCPSVVEAITLTFSSLYYVPSSLATIAGTYTEPATGTAFTISADGTVYAQDATTGCVINGAVSIINASYNVYAIQVSYASCTGALTPLNGVTLAGLAAVNNSLSPVQVIAGVWTSTEPAQYSVTYTLVRS